MKVPSHTSVAAYASLFIALGGTGYAATQLAPNSVGSREVRNGSITQKDLARGVVSRKNAKLAQAITQVVSDPATGLNIKVTAQDGAPGPQGPQGNPGTDSTAPGPQGPQGVRGETGAKGDQGIAGGLWAYGAVNANGTGTVSGFTVTHPSTGIYCMDTNSGTFHVATATPYGDGAAITLAHVALAPSSGGCAGKSVQVTINDTSSNLTDMAFYFMGT